MWRSILRGAVAGAAGTTALNATTYLDMALRGRPPSSTTDRAVERLSSTTGLPVPGEGERRASRVSAIGALLGIATGIGAGVGYAVLCRTAGRPPVALGALLVGGAAMAGADVPLTLLGVTDPRTWSPQDWLSDVVPHLVYGVVTAAAFAMAGMPARPAAAG